MISLSDSWTFKQGSCAPEVSLAHSSRLHNDAVTCICWLVLSESLICRGLLSWKEDEEETEDVSEEELEEAWKGLGAFLKAGHPQPMASARA